MALAKVPVLVSGVHGHTEGPGPFADVMRFAKAFEPSSQSPPPTLPGARQVDRSKVLSTNLFLVHPYLDLPDMGGGAVVVTDGDAQLAADIARTIAMRYWDRRFDLDPPTMTPEQAIIAGRAMTERPVLLVETSDCAGGGAAGDSVATLRALLACGADHDAAMSALVPVVDPEAAAACHAAGAGATLTLDLGHKLDPKWGKPLRVTGRVAAVSDGRFRYTGGIWEGLEKSMGRSAVLAIGSTRVLVMSQPTYDWADEQFRSMNLRAEEAKFVVVKNPMNFRFAYAGMAQKWIVLDTPGPTPPHLHHVCYERMKRPYYPADKDIPGLTPALVVRPSRF
jgi:microcystin degradation protein MlrC